ncbi:glutathione gamma-glutamylcysteinyltransferase [Hydra vulgaris]|uniref:glutathione gamma-glutamylcysteinyltransferase n=1 Tax=Hydra vulgaris TaxID=6087 RepID=UPI000641041C|nr:glutathione gamma-glutamylcysteinyltransferase [Hydra vulgaris]XP_047146792.1 glutathione gamma-glutamylcysteinyltransferase [Hydra vulgaris]
MVFSIVQYSIPQGLIGLHTSYGQKMLSEAMVVNKNYALHELKQIHPTYCGPASLAFLINAIHAMSYLNLTKELINENDIVFGKQKDFFQHININETGMTIANMSSLAKLLGLNVHSYYTINQLKPKKKDYDTTKLDAMIKSKEGDISLVKTKKNVRELLIKNLKNPSSGVIANFNTSLLGYKIKYGHFSPIAAYHKNKDMFLIMDVWPMTPPAWVKTSRLFKAMATVDSDSNLPRGFLSVKVQIKNNHLNKP